MRCVTRSRRRCPFANVYTTALPIFLAVLTILPDFSRANRARITVRLLTPRARAAVSSEQKYRRSRQRARSTMNRKSRSCVVTNFSVLCISFYLVLFVVSRLVLNSVGARLWKLIHETLSGTKGFEEYEYSDLMQQGEPSKGGSSCVERHPTVLHRVAQQIPGRTLIERFCATQTTYAPVRLSFYPSPKFAAANPRQSAAWILELDHSRTEDQDSSRNVGTQGSTSSRSTPRIDGICR